MNLKLRQLVVFSQPTDGTYDSQAVLTKGTIAPLSFPNGAIAVAQCIQ